MTKEEMIAEAKAAAAAYRLREKDGTSRLRKIRKIIAALPADEAAAIRAAAL